MAGEDGSEEARLIGALAAHPEDFSFYQAIRRLEAVFPERARVGYAYHVKDDVVRFAQDPTLGFGPAPIKKFEDSENDYPPKMLIDFMGFLGPNGPLPLHFTEMIYDRLRHHKDRTHAHFLDIFLSRIVSLFYRAWAVNQLTANYHATRTDSFAKFVSCFIGRGTPAFYRRDSVSDDAKRFYAGWLAAESKSAEGLRSILGEYFEAPCEIEEFVGQWIPIPAECICKLGSSRETGLVGVNLIMGTRFWDRQQKFRIRLGPMGLHQFLSMLPSGERLVRLIDWVRNYLGEELEWDVCLVLRREEVPQTVLGRAGQLGWTTWLQTEETVFWTDRDDLQLDSATIVSWIRAHAA